MTREPRVEDGAYRRLFEVNPHPMWVYDLETLGFLVVNDAAIRRYGYSHEEFLALTIRDIRPPEDVPALLRNVAGVGQGLDQAGLWRHRLKDGSLIDVDITFFLPLSFAPPVPEPAPGPRPAAGETILLVEDEEMVLGVVGSWLRDAGYRVVAARDGEEAVAVFREKHGDIDLVVCDLGLPGLARVLAGPVGGA